MNLETNKAIARGYLHELVNNGNLAAFDIYLSEDVVFNNSSDAKSQFIARMSAIRSAFPDHHLTIEDQIAEGDRVVTRVTFHGTHQGDSAAWPRPGRSSNTRGLRLIELPMGRWWKCGTCPTHLACCNKSETRSRLPCATSEAEATLCKNTP
jgi:steroid delta-isomerase-like uncharacterized protein